jgi:hypothetical protein
MSEFFENLKPFDRILTRGGWIALIRRKVGDYYEGTIFSPKSAIFGRVGIGLWNATNGKFILNDNCPGLDLIEACCLPR